MSAKKKVVLEASYIIIHKLKEEDPSHTSGRFTSSAASSFESNWQKICSSSLRITLASTFRRPLMENRQKFTFHDGHNCLRKQKGWLLIYLCGMPIITFSTPFSLDLSMMVLSAGIRDSDPSSPKRFSDDHFLCKNSSNLTEPQHYKNRHIFTQKVPGHIWHCLYIFETFSMQIRNSFDGNHVFIFLIYFRGS